jgi:transposase
VIDEAAIRLRYQALAPHLDERGLRLFAASEARTAGRGGIAAVSRATGIAPSTIGRGLKDLTADEGSWPQGRVRRTGGGRKSAVVKQPGLVEALTQLVESAIRGDPQAPLLWVSRSQRHLAEALGEQGFSVSHKVVGRLLHDMGFSLQANAKTREGSNHPDRDAQFEHINKRVRDFQDAGQPAISVDTKKKELVGDFKNPGRELRPKGRPEAVRVHDFMIKALGKAVPYCRLALNCKNAAVSVILGT